MFFKYPMTFLVLVLLPLTGLLFAYAEKKRRKALSHFAGARGSLHGSILERRFELASLMLAAGLIIMALARPAVRMIPVEVGTKGRDVVFLLDVSRSMLAEDLAPNRLESAKTAIRDCVATLDGDRVAFVVFSGAGSILCPLTTDFGFFLDKLDEADPDVVAPGDVRVGGTRIGDAIHKVCDKLFTVDRTGFQDLILISDGGDQESNPTEAVKRLDQLGAYFMVVGIGDPTRGARIPKRPEDGEGFVMHEGREVWSKLEAGSLQKIAKSSRHGVFQQAGTCPLPLGKLYHQVVPHFQRNNPEQSDVIMQAEDMFAGFIAAALFLLAPPFARWTRQRQWGGKTAAVACLAIFLTTAMNSNAEEKPRSAKASFREGVKMLEATNFATAIGEFRNAAAGFADPRQRAAALYNAGNCAFEVAEAEFKIDPQSLAVPNYLEEATEFYRASLEAVPSFSSAAWNLEFVSRLLNDRNDGNAPDGDSDEGESEDSDSQEEGEEQEGEEGEMEEYDEDAEMEASNQMSDEQAMNMETQDLPPPTVDPEEILEQEAENRASRQKQKATKYKAVEKDW